MNFCKDCVHYTSLRWANPMHRCQAPKNQRIDLVTGEVSFLMSANEQRLQSSGDHCRAEGYWWELKPITVTTNVPMPVEKPWYKFWS